MKRQLPSRRNPLLSLEQTPSRDELVSKRHLGQTDLRVKTGQVGTSNATRPANLGLFDYVHLRAPLPQNLNGSEILLPARPGDPYPRHYFLMRRSSDGYVSASGLFKAAFPWASKKEEVHERSFIQSLPTTDQNEVAGNFWVAPDSALDIASDYGIALWVKALLDPRPIAAPSNKPEISSPPTFQMAKSAAGDHPNKSARKRTATPQPNNASPSKMPAPARPKATPRRRGPKKKDQSTSDATPSVVDSAAESEDVEDAAEAATNAVSEGLVDGAATKGAGSNEPLAKNTARVTVNSDVQDDGAIETTRTSVKVEMPADAASQPLPESPEQALEAAKKIVADAVTMQDGDEGAPAVPAAGRKRKASEAVELVEPEEEIVEVADSKQGSRSDKVHFGERRGAPPAKRTRIMVPATDFRREKMQKRALMGLSASLAIGAAIPFVSGFF
ncbi:MAG: hypothetical protein M1828_001536 [Chrysothrix sp. TS-e1954]|nr:MAG: hypothetical protein M1828_001536 [Chrysothrix sp. TS-e1954]